MRGAVIYAPGDVRVEERDDPKIIKSVRSAGYILVPTVTGG